MKKTFAFLTLALGLGLAQAEIVQMHDNPPDDQKPHPKDLTPSVEKNDSLIDVRVPEPADLDVCIYDAGGQSVIFDRTHAAEISIPTPASGSYTIEVCVDGNVYVGEFVVDIESISR